LFKNGKQKPNTDSRKVLTTEDAAAPDATRNDSSDEGSGLSYNVA